jgi:hypothetical protein
VISDRCPVGALSMPEAPLEQVARGCASRARGHVDLGDVATCALGGHPGGVGAATVADFPACPWVRFPCRRACHEATRAGRTGEAAIEGRER